MKRFHVHLHVQDLQASIAFYSRLFSAQPSLRRKSIEIAVKVGPSSSCC